MYYYYWNTLHHQLVYYKLVCNIYSYSGIKIYDLAYNSYRKRSSDNNKRKQVSAVCDVKSHNTG